MAISIPQKHQAISEHTLQNLILNSEMIERLLELHLEAKDRARVFLDVKRNLGDELAALMLIVIWKDKRELEQKRSLRWMDLKRNSVINDLINDRELLEKVLAGVETQAKTIKENPIHNFEKVARQSSRFQAAFLILAHWRFETGQARMHDLWGQAGQKIRQMAIYSKAI